MLDTLSESQYPRVLWLGQSVYLTGNHPYLKGGFTMMHLNDTFKSCDQKFHEVVAAQPKEDPGYQPPEQSAPRPIRLRRYES